MNQQKPLTFHIASLALLLVAIVLMQHSRLEAQDWMQFRGASGSAASADADLQLSGMLTRTSSGKWNCPAPVLRRRSSLAIKLF